MNKIVIRISIFIILLNMLLFTGCYDRREIEDQTYVIAIGFDKGTTMPLRLTLLYPLTAPLGGETGGLSSDKKVATVTIEAQTFYAALSLANSFIAKRINFSHCVAAVFSEQLAKTVGVGKYVNAMMRNRETRPDINIAVSRGSAEKFMSMIQPLQENDVSKYFQMIFNTYRFTGFTPCSSISKFYDDIVTIEKSPTAVLVDVSKFTSSDDFKIISSSLEEKNKKQPLEGDFKAGEVAKIGGQKCEYLGMAVFDGEKMVGEMDGEDATNLLMITGDFKMGYFTIPDPKKKGYFVVLTLYPSRRPIAKIELESGNPKINVKLELEADFRSIQSGINYEDSDKTKVIEEFAGDFFKKEVENFLERTAKKYGVDICGFGSTAKKQFLTYDTWESYQWLSKYQMSEFTVDMKIHVRRPGLFVKTAPIAGSESDGDSE